MTQEDKREGKKKHWSEEFDELFEFDGVIYKGQRHWKRGVKNGLVKRFIKNLLISKRQLLGEKIKEKLLAKARKTDYADRTEYDEAWEIVSRVLQSNLEDKE